VNKKTNLLKKTSKTFLLTGLVLAILSSIVLYIFTKILLNNEVEEVLYSTESRIVDALKRNGELYSLPPITVIKKVKSLGNDVIKDTIIYDPSQDEMELFRELSTFKNINGINYQITIRNMVVESDNFLYAIVFSNITIFFLAFIFLFYFNTKRNLQLWSPFFKNLEQMKRFSLTSKQPIELVDSDVLEFSELKNEIAQLTNKVKTDYDNLKQFTENISHEMQTPLAIIQAKTDNIINENTISNKQFEQITSIQKDVQRLKQLNKRVTILTKIDNNQFGNIEIVNITKLIDEKIENYKELKLANLFHASNDDLFASMDLTLADILINNLITNAIKYNIKDEVITIITNKSSLVISNFGQNPLKNPEYLFFRFYKESKTTQSTGLGLAIVKKICDLYEFEISYKFEKNHHVFSVNFSQ
jgi:hypothetical protein